MRTATLVALAAVTIASPALAAEPFVWKIVGISDGDSVRAIDEANVEHKVRLFGFDAPESKQAFGTVARDRLAALVKGKTATVHIHDTDKYGRTVARIEVDGIDVNNQLVTEGMAWHYKRYSDDPKLAEAEAAARAAKLGLWADEKPVPPWEWRATEKDRK